MQDTCLCPGQAVLPAQDQVQSPSGPVILGKQVSKTKTSEECVQFTWQRCDCLLPAAYVCRRDDLAGLPSSRDPWCLAYYPCSKAHYPGSTLFLPLLHISLPSPRPGAELLAGRSGEAAASSGSKTSAPPCAESWRSGGGIFRQVFGG